MAPRVVAARVSNDRLPEVGERTRDRILSVALDEFANAGFDGTTMSGIARRAGVTQPLVHYHFDSKDALWRAAVEAAFLNVDDSLEEVVAELTDLGLVAQMKVLVRRFVRFSAAHPEIGRIVFYESVRGGPRLNWLVEQHLPSGLDWFGPLYGQAVDAGLIKALPAEHVMSALSASSAYLFIARAAMLEVNGIDVTDPAVIDAHTDVVVEIFFHGLAAGGVSA